MYARYLRERENKEILQAEHGFAIYGYNCVPGVDFPHCYIQDVYIVPEKRRSGLASELADKISKQAKAAGFKTLISSIDIKAEGADISLRVLQGYGMKLYATGGNAIYMIKELN